MAADSALDPETTKSCSRPVLLIERQIGTLYKRSTVMTGAARQCLCLVIISAMLASNTAALVMTVTTRTASKSQAPSETSCVGSANVASSPTSAASIAGDSLATSTEVPVNGEISIRAAKHIVET